MDYSDEEIPQEIQECKNVDTADIGASTARVRGTDGRCIPSGITGRVSERPWYHRPNSVDRASVPNTYYRITVLEEIRITLLEVGGHDLVDRFREGPFGHFIGWTSGSVCSSALHGIVARCIWSSTGILFHLNGNDIEYTVQDHALITGLRFGAFDFDSTHPHDPSGLRLFEMVCGGSHLSGADLSKRFRNRIPPHEANIYLGCAHVLMTSIFVCGHDAQKMVFPWLWTLASDMCTFYEYPWGAYSYKILRNYLRKISDNQRYHFYGPAWSLMIWGLELLPGVGNVAGKYRGDEFFPRCLRWNFRKTSDLPGSSDIRSFYSDLDCYDVTNIIMEEAERSLPYVTSLYCPYPLAVSYAPLMSITSGDQRRVRHTRPPVVVDNVSGPRSTRSARPVVDQEPAEQTRPARRRVDMRKRGRVQMPDSSSSSSGGPPPPRADIDMIRDILQTEVRASEARIRDDMRAEVIASEAQIKDDMRAEIKASEGRIKTWMQGMFDSMRFGPARRSPPITGSGRPSRADEKANAPPFGPYRHSTSDIGRRQLTAGDESDVSGEVIAFGSPSREYRPPISALFPLGVYERFVAFMKKPLDATVFLKGNGAPITVGDFRTMLNMNEDLYTWNVDLFLKTLEVQLIDNYTVYPSHSNGKTVICKTDFFTTLAFEYKNFVAESRKSVAMKNMSAHIRNNWVPSQWLCEVVHGVAYDRTCRAWWDANEVSLYFSAPVNS
ncbi:hypothetical protein OROGR_009206 [Orobanche gracilis]